MYSILLLLEEGSLANALRKANCTRAVYHLPEGITGAILNQIALQATLLLASYPGPSGLGTRLRYYINGRYYFAIGILYP